MDYTQNYELYFILQPNLNNTQVDEHIALVEKHLATELKATNIVVDNQGLKKLAYQIKKHVTGTYILVTFDLDNKNPELLPTLERKMNLFEEVIRYIVINQSDYNIQAGKQTVRVDSEVTNHRDLNKGLKRKKSYPDYLGMRVVDYKNVDFLNQFISPYSKIFSKDRTGTSSKMQRKVKQAIKRARHMALISFTPQYNK